MPFHTAKELFKQIDSRLNGFAKFLLITALFISLIVLLDSGGRLVNQHVLGIYPSDHPIDYTYITVSHTADMEVVLRRHNLWHVEDNAQVDPVVFTRYPSKPADKKISIRKRIFFHVLLPAALIAQAEVRRDRQFIIKSIAQIRKAAGFIDFDSDKSDWQKNLTRASVNKLIDISEKYQDVNAASLLTKVDVIPVSLILAQSAIESAWGKSRFATNGNNLFGIWTWGENGMVPKERDSGKTHRVAVFVSILDSVRAYTLMLNRLSAYQRFRDVRSQSRDSLELAEGLLNYSSRRSFYVNDIKKMIKQNNLKSFDTNSLSLKKKGGGLM